jgi:thiamine-phosphate pyrophosphorylase
MCEAARYGDRNGDNDLDAPELLLGLLAEAECRASAVLLDCGIDAEAVIRRWPRLGRRANLERAEPPRLSTEVQASLDAAQARLVDYPRPLVLATEHLLLGLAAAATEVAGWLAEHGLSADRLELEIHELSGFDAAPVEIDAEPGDGSFSCSDSPEGTGDTTSLIEPVRTASYGTSGFTVLRIIDAAANRAREGLRVVEDYVRFVLDDRHLTEQLKALRHDLTAALAGIPRHDRLVARETPSDVGTQVTTESEARRDSAADVLSANFARLTEALRSLEEYGKLIDSERSASFEALRYRAYTLQRAVVVTSASRSRLADVRLYVLMDGRPSPEEFARLAGILVAAGVDAIQLRDKALNDRQLIWRGRVLRETTAGTRTLYVMNDRPDLAVLTRADAVHVGQEELDVKDTRGIVGAEILVGVSTHSVVQARQAVIDGADYIGVGPTFPSSTKQFAAFPGVDLLRTVAAEITLPAFAIGGITSDNLNQVLEAGVARVAVGSAITSAADPAAEARRFKDKLLMAKAI